MSGAVSLFICDPGTLEDFLVSEARAREGQPVEGDCEHCGEPLGLDDDPYAQACGYCGREIYGGAS